MRITWVETHIVPMYLENQFRQFLVQKRCVSSMKWQANNSLQNVRIGNVFISLFSLHPFFLFLTHALEYFISKSWKWTSYILGLTLAVEQRTCKFLCSVFDTCWKRRHRFYFPGKKKTHFIQGASIWSWNFKRR